MIKLDMEEINKNVKMKTKTDVLAIRVSVGLKDKFQKACEGNGVQASAVIREFMAEYVRLTKQKGNS